MKAGRRIAVFIFIIFFCSLISVLARAESRIIVTLDDIDFKDQKIIFGGMGNYTGRRLKLEIPKGESLVFKIAQGDMWAEIKSLDPGFPKYRLTLVYPAIRDYLIAVLERHGKVIDSCCGYQWYLF